MTVSSRVGQFGRWRMALLSPLFALIALPVRGAPPAPGERPIAAVQCGLTIGRSAPSATTPAGPPSRELSSSAPGLYQLLCIVKQLFAAILNLIWMYVKLFC